jgi:hypothetical protein
VDHRACHWSRRCDYLSNKFNLPLFWSFSHE